MGLAKSLPTGCQGRLWGAGVNLGQAATHMPFSPPRSLPLLSPVRAALRDSVGQLFLSVDMHTDGQEAGRVSISLRAFGRFFERLTRKGICSA